MGHRLTQIATRTGDDGSTGLGDGSRTAKDRLSGMALRTIAVLLVLAKIDRIIRQSTKCIERGGRSPHPSGQEQRGGKERLGSAAHQGAQGVCVHTLGGGLRLSCAWIAIGKVRRLHDGSLGLRVR